MNRIFTILLILIGSCGIFAQTNISGTISVDDTLDAAGSPYTVTGHLTVNPGITLTIDSSVVVQFAGGTRLYLNGSLNARHVEFTSSQASPAKGDWDYIRVGYSSYVGSATFDTCIIKYGGASYFPSQNGMIYVYNGNASFNGCDISYSNNYGIMLRGPADLDINNTNISFCDWPITYIGQGAVDFHGLNNLTGNTHDGIYMRFGGNSNSMQLDTIDVPYAFLQNYTISAGGSLEIASTNMLKFGSGVRLSVNGTLIADASPGENIYFTAYTDDNVGGDTNGDGTATSPASRYWDGVYFYDSSDDVSCVMRRCMMSFAGSGNIGAISMENASPTINLCDMANNYYGAMIKDVSNPVFTENTIGSSEVVPIAMSFDANPIFTNNTLSFSDNQYDALGLISGSLQADAVLPIRSVTGIPNITYLMLGDLIIPATYTLTINKGIVIKSYNYHHSIIVRGKLVADASANPDSMITFTSVKDDNHGNPNDTNRDGTQTSPDVGDWGGIVFEATSDTNSIMNYCRIKYASFPSTWYNTRYISSGAITTVNADPTISNCEIQDIIYGIYAFQSSYPDILNNHIINTQRTPIALSVSSDPQFSGNTFTNPSWEALGLIGEQLGADGTISLRNVGGNDSITYVLLENLTVNSGTYVTVDSGVVIKFNTNTAIYINGGFEADGTPGNGQIVFTSLKDDNYGNPKDTNGDGSGSSPSANDWRIIRFQDTSDDGFNLIDNSLVLFAGSGSSPTSYGAVSFVNAGGTVSNSIISDSYYYGVECAGNSTPMFSSVEIKNSRLSPIAMSLLSNPTFSNITFLGNATNGIQILEGTLSSNATLNKRNVAGITNIAYIVDQLTISPNAILTIDPGVVIKFNDYYDYINVNGALSAVGTTSEEIVFTSLEDDSRGGDTNNDGNSTTPNPGDWYSIIYNASGIDSLNVLEHCLIRYGGSGYSSYNYTQYGLVRIYNCEVDIDSCTLEQSYTTGIGIYGSANPTIDDCNLINIRYTPISMSMFATPSFNNNFVSNLGIRAIGIVPENYSVTATVPKRNFAGFQNITYYLFNHITINSGTTITVADGTVFKYRSSGEFRVNGALVTDGTLTDPVVFTHEYDDDYGNPNDTNGDGSLTTPTISSSYYSINFYDVSDDSASSINHTIMRYRHAGINLQQASPSITNCLFDRGNWGVVLRGVSNPVVENNTFHNLGYTAMILSLVSYPSSAAGNVISGTTYRAIGILQEELVQDVTLSKRNFANITNIPYYFSGNYTIGTSVTLTIEPGLIFKFPSYQNITVNKGFIAEGGATPDSTIVFTDIRDDFYGGDTNADSTNSFPSYSSGWDGIRFAGDSWDALCRLDYCIIKYAGRAGSTSGGIVTTNASPTITNCVLTKNRNGIIANQSSNPVVNYCDIYDNYNWGINNVHKSFNMDAQWNWWGDDTGPTHSGNPGGTGQAVSDSVNYGNFFTSGANNPLVGDVSLNGTVQAFDASLVLQETVAPGLLNPRQLLVADVSGNLGVTAYDASLILQYVVGLISGFPVELNNKMLKQHPELQETVNRLALQKISDGSLEIGSTKVNAGEKVVIPLKIDNMTGLTAMQMVLKFNSSILEIESISTTGLTSNMSLLYETNVETGELRIALAGTKMLELTGEVLQITFNVSEKARGKNSCEISVQEFLANETDLTSKSIAGSVEVVGKPISYSLSQNYPNPFNSTTLIKYQLPYDQTKVKIEIFSITGQLVKTLVNTQKDAGEYRVTWNGTNNNGLLVSSGLYLYRMQAGEYSITKKFHLMK